MKKILTLLILFSIMLGCITGCGEKSELSPDDPVTLTLWHVYGEQASSPMNLLVNEFNQTVGREKGIIINVTSMTNASKVGPELLEAQTGHPGAPEMPDLFFCHNNNAEALGKDNLVNWNELFTEQELSEIVPEFLADGMVDDSLAVFPVSKSTHLLFMASGVFGRFSADTGVTYETLSTWDGFFEAAEKYYEWSGGTAFCAVDYPLRCIELYAMSQGTDDFYKDGWYDYSNETFKDCFMKFASSISEGHIMVSDLYSNTQVMTGEVACGIGSSASILYYNDTITYPDNTNEPMNLKVLPLPQAGNGKNLVTQAGVGLACYKTTTQKAEAAAAFAKWLTESDRNLAFVAETGYMPIKKKAFNKIKTYEFKDEGYESLYEVLGHTAENCTAVTEPNFPDYYTKVYDFYGNVRIGQRNPETYESPEAFAEAIWEMFTSVNKIL